MSKLTDEEIKTIQELEEAGFEIMLDISIEDLKNSPPPTQEERQRAIKFVEEMERRRIEELKNTEK